jgi:hypothetical protein
MTNGPIPPQLSELQKLQFDYAWKWFSYHADQRVKMFNFMLAIFGIFAAAVVGAVANHLPAGFTAILCGIAAALGLIFPRLDRRNRDLVWLGEELLAHLERTVIFGEGVGIRGRNGESIQLGILLRQSVEERARDERPLMDILRLWAWGAAAGS